MHIALRQATAIAFALFSATLFLSNNCHAELVAYYDFESPNPFADKTGNGHDALTGPNTNVTLSPGVIGISATFPGIGSDLGLVTEDDHLTVPLEQAPDFGTGDISVSLWYRRNDPQDDTGISGGDGGVDGIYDSLDVTVSGIQLFALSNGTVNGRFDTADAGFAVVNSDPFTLEDNEDDSSTFTWHHIAYTVDRSAAEAILYFDGLEIDSFSPAGDPGDITSGNISPSQDFWIGRANEHLADGSIDDFALFNQVLTAEEVAALFAQTLSPADFLESLTPGDFDGDGLLTADDIDRLSAAVRDSVTDRQFDLNEDGNVDDQDRMVWINELKFTWVGDANLDGEFNSSDFVSIFTVGKYETGEDASWSEGDWNGDGEFSSADFVTAFVVAGYEQGPRTAVAAVPEPSSITLLLIGVLGFIPRRR